MHEETKPKSTAKDSWWYKRWSKEEICCICLSRLRPKSTWKLTCGHRLHMSCMQQMQKNTCPLCRHPL